MFKRGAAVQIQNMGLCCFPLCRLSRLKPQASCQVKVIEGTQTNIKEQNTKLWNWDVDVKSFCQCQLDARLFILKTNSDYCRNTHRLITYKSFHICFWGLPLNYFVSGKCYWAFTGGSGSFVPATIIIKESLQTVALVSKKPLCLFNLWWWSISL